eukprot:4011016-Pyramimonas_sp.AAC.1
MITTTNLIAIAPCRSHRDHLRRRRGRRARAGARTSQTAGIQADEETDSMVVKEASTSGTGATVMTGMILEAAETIGRGN